MPISYRRLSGEDLADAERVEDFVFKTDRWSTQQLLQELESEDTFYVGAYREQKIVGVAGVRGYYHADIMTLAVLEEARGLGIGKELVRRLLDAADNKGWSPTFLEVRASNNAAIQLYTNAGFEVLGRVRGYYRNPREDALRMVRQ